MKNDEAHEAHESGPEAAMTPLEAAALEHDGIDLESAKAFLKEIQEIADAINNQDYTAPAISKLFNQIKSLSASGPQQEDAELKTERQYRHEGLGMKFTLRKWASLSPEEKVERLAHKVRRLLDRLQRLEQDHFQVVQDFHVHRHMPNGEIVTQLCHRGFNPCGVAQLAPNLNDPLDAMD